jgi:hypothetical protein
VCCVLIIRYDSRIDRAIAQVIHPPPRSITCALWRFCGSSPGTAG